MLFGRVKNQRSGGTPQFGKHCRRHDHIFTGCGILEAPATPTKRRGNANWDSASNEEIVFIVLLSPRLVVALSTAGFHFW